MFGKHFASTYQGSLHGKGAMVFALWGYVIATQTPDRVVGSQVHLNPDSLAPIFGEPVEALEAAITFLCAPDPKSTSPDAQGRRLVKIGQFSYQVVNGAKYRAIRDEEERRAGNRDAKRRERARKKGLPLPGEVAYLRASENGASEAELDRVVDSRL